MYRMSFVRFVAAASYRCSQPELTGGGRRPIRPGAVSWAWPILPPHRVAPLFVTLRHHGIAGDLINRVIGCLRESSPMTSKTTISVRDIDSGDVVSDLMKPRLDPMAVKYLAN